MQNFLFHLTRPDMASVCKNFAFGSYTDLFVVAASEEAARQVIPGDSIEKQVADINECFADDLEQRDMLINSLHANEKRNPSWVKPSDVICKKLGIADPELKVGIYLSICYSE